MRFKKMLLVSALGVVVLLLSVSHLSFSGTTGKVSGFVRDAETGDPLPGANVVLDGTLMGAATDMDGYFFIINVPPGKYDLNATMMGYQTQSAKIVVHVDLTVKVKFNLKPILQT